MMEMLEKTAAALERRHFKAAVFKTAQEAASFILSDMPDGASVAFGGSFTCQQMGLAQLLRENGHEVLWHWEVAPAERPALLHQAMNAQVYICSANALTQDGLLVQIDGNGNRVAAMFGGPKKVVLVVGKNKLAADLESGMARVKAVACSKNAQRFGLDTPCAITGKCVDCHHAQRICSVTTIIEQKPRLLDELHIVLVDEELGY